MQPSLVLGAALVAATCIVQAQQQAAGGEWKLTPEQEARKAELEKTAKPLQKDVTFDILTGGAIKGAITGSAAKAATGVATGTVTKGGGEAVKQKVKAYKKARKVKIDKEAEPPVSYGSGSGGAQK